MPISVLICNINLLCNKAFISKSLSSLLFHADERLWIFALRASVLELIFSIWFDGRKAIWSVKPAQQFRMETSHTCLKALLTYTLILWLLNSFDLPSYSSESRKRYTLRLLIHLEGEFWKLLLEWPVWGFA